MNDGWLGIPWFVYGIGCALVAITYLVVPVAPYKNFPWGKLSTWSYFVLRWLHSIVWIFLLTACAYIQIIGNKGKDEAKLIAFVGLAIYIVYLAFLLKRRTSKLTKK